ncbi:MAG TPA: hypothetical protein VGY58_02830 [Gemmataceae bacterium]|nr:hypothetical protein [Gemmataceae bacterium]
MNAGRCPSQAAVRGITVLGAAFALLVVAPSCQNYLPDLAHVPAFPGRTCVQEGIVTVRDGDEVQVCYKPVYHAPPRLAIVEISQSWFKDLPFKKEDFELRQQEAASFKILGKHRERHYGAWAIVKWRAEGVRAGEHPEGPKSRQEQIIAMVERAGGKVTLDVRTPGAPITAIDLHRSRVTDADLALLPGLATLRILNLHATGISDAGLAHLAGLGGLQALYLNDTAVSDAGLQHVQRLSALKELGLYHTRVSDAGLAYLVGLNNLQTLSLSGSHITDQGMHYLKRLPNLKSLTLSQTRVSDLAARDLEQSPPKKTVLR